MILVLPSILLILGSLIITFEIKKQEAKRLEEQFNEKMNSALKTLDEHYKALEHHKKEIDSVKARIAITKAYHPQ